MLKLIKHLKPYIWLLIVLIGLVIVQVITNLQLPDYMAKIVNEGVVGQNNSLILSTGYRMLAISLIGAAATVGVGFLASKVATGFSMDIRRKVFSKVESFSLAEFNIFSTASLITRSTNDIQQIQMVLIMFLRMVLAAPIIGFGAVVKAYHTAPSMSWIMALAVIIMLGIIITLFSIALPKFQLLQKLVDKLNLVTRQNLTGLRVIRAFNNERIEEENFEKANVDLTEANLYVNRLMVFMQPIMMLIFNFTSIAIVWFGAHLISTGDLMIGNMLAFMQYSMQVIMSFLMVSIIFIMIPRASVSGKRVAEVLETDPTIKDPAKADRPKVNTGLVEFKNVTFSYPGADLPVLEDITLTARPGEMTAFIGSTGSGKSTLINLIPRFYDVTSGEILIDGVDVRQMKLEDLYERIGYVPQKGILFSGTVASNIKYGAPKATEEKVEKAVKTAQVDEFIKQLSDGLDSTIAQGGTNVSGGQKQRLAIARALVKDAQILIFDDSFSALDFRTDAALRKALGEETKDKTVLVVGQRISTIMNADQIIVLDEGKIVGMGKHQELLESCSVYKEIASSQLSEEELQNSGGKTAKKTNQIVSGYAIGEELV